MTQPEKQPLSCMSIALKVLKGHWQELLVCGLLAQLPSLLASVWFSRAAVPLLEKAGIYTNPYLIELALREWAAEHAVVIGLFAAAMILLAPILTTVTLRHIIHAPHRDQITEAEIIRPLLQGMTPLRILLLRIRVALRLLLCVLPAYLSLFGSLLMIVNRWNVSLAPTLTSLGSAAAVVLTIRTNYTYLPSQYLQAINPAVKTGDILRACRAIMHGRRIEAFREELPVLALTLLVIVLSDIPILLFGNVVGTVVYLFASLVMTVLLWAVRTVYTMRRTGEIAMEEKKKEKSVDADA